MNVSSKLRVAAVQVESLNGKAADNLRRAEKLVSEAAARGARLVVCPEFLAAGYIYDDSIWDVAEPRGGMTERWLQRLSAAHRIYLGASYLEVAGDDFFNTFALAAPNGTIAGRVRKESLPAFEGWYFKGCAEPKSIDTELGRISVGICQDNQTVRFFRRVARDRPDLILMPHSAPCMPFGASVMRRSLSEVGAHYAREFGVPVVLVNKTAGRCHTPIPGVPFVRLRFDFPGLSSICDSDGRVLAELPDREGIVIGDVELEPGRKRAPAAPKHRYWARPPETLPRLLGAFFVVMERLGARAYRKNPKRVRAAQAMTQRFRANSAASSRDELGH